MRSQRCANEGPQATAAGRAAGGLVVYIDANRINPVDGRFSRLERNAWRCRRAGDCFRAGDGGRKWSVAGSVDFVDGRIRDGKGDGCEDGNKAAS